MTFEKLTLSWKFIKVLLLCKKIFLILQDGMKGSLAKARVLYAPVEEIGSEGHLLRACRIHI